MGCGSMSAHWLERLEGAQQLEELGLGGGAGPPKKHNRTYT